MQRLVRAYAAIDADNQLVTIADSFFQTGLLNAIAFGETMRHVITGLGPQHPQRSQQDRRARRAVNIIVAIDQDWLLIIDGLQHALYRL